MRPLPRSSPAPEASGWRHDPASRVRGLRWVWGACVSHPAGPGTPGLQAGAAEGPSLAASPLGSHGASQAGTRAHAQDVSCRLLPPGLGLSDPSFHHFTWKDQQGLQRCGQHGCSQGRSRRPASWKKQLAAPRLVHASIAGAATQPLREHVPIGQTRNLRLADRTRLHSKRAARRFPGPRALFSAAVYTRYTRARTHMHPVHIL